MSKLTFYAEFKNKPNETKIRNEILSQAAPEGKLRYPELNKYQININDSLTISLETAQNHHNCNPYRIDVYKLNEENESAKAKQIQKRIETFKKKINNFINTHGQKTRTSEYISCPHCKSKIHKASFEEKCKEQQRLGWNCPVCKQNMESTTFNNKIQTYQKEIEHLSKLLNEELKKPSGKTYYLALATVHN